MKPRQTLASAGLKPAPDPVAPRATPSWCHCVEAGYPGPHRHSAGCEQQSTPSGLFDEAARFVGGEMLTPEQTNALDAIQKWFLDGRSRGEPFRLFGAAGTGKTTLAKFLDQALGVRRIAYAAYTGKAAHVLCRKGVPATTIHSAIYTPTGTPAELRAEWERAQRELAALQEMNGQSEDIEREIEALERAMRKPGWEVNPDSRWADMDLIVLDECSMVNARMAADIESFEVPVLVLGDPHQLPPIEGGGVYTRSAPDVELKEVHRQALESPVLRLATEVRQGTPWDDHLVRVDLRAAMAADQIIVWKNSTRWALTERIRKELGRPAGQVIAGDRVTCLTNNREIGILNGQQFDVLAVEPGPLGPKMFVRDDEGRERTLDAYPGGFEGLAGEKQMKETATAWRGRRGAFTFANVITCHKAQGSEWEEVYVVDQTHQMWRSTAAEKRSWLYTATTRAQEKVTLASTEVR